MAKSVAKEDSNVATHARSWLSATEARAAAVAKLALAEAKLAALSVAMMAFFGTLAAAFTLVAWGLGVAAIIRLLTELDISIWGGMLAMALAHVVAAVLLWRAAKKLGDNLEFSATRQQFVRPEAGS